jgi:hypothetical protein
LALAFLAMGNRELQGVQVGERTLPAADACTLPLPAMGPLVNGSACKEELWFRLSVTVQRASLPLQAARIVLGSPA